MTTFPLQEGVNTIGSDSSCDIHLEYPQIAPAHCRVTLPKDGNYKLKSLESVYGIYRVTPFNPYEKLIPNKEYQLLLDGPFYIGGRYKCVVEINSDNGNVLYQMIP